MHNTDDVRDELFCQGFELEALADFLVRNETERWVSGFANLNVEVEHTNRYKWVAQFVTGKKVLDIACGSGKGSYLLAEEGRAEKVVGCDLDSKAIRYASIRNKHENVSFLSGDAQQFDDGTTYDVIVSFETIEHIPDVAGFLASIRRSLGENGEFYVSTPISWQQLDAKPLNPYHLREWGFRSFQDLLAKDFLVEKKYVQLSYQQYQPVLPNFPFLRKTARFYHALRRYWSAPGGSSLGPQVMAPVEYEREKFPEDALGKSFTGYQILKCSKLPQANKNC